MLKRLDGGHYCRLFLIGFLWWGPGNSLSVNNKILFIDHLEIIINILKLLVTWCTNKFNIQQLYALPTEYLCFVFIWEQTATCATYGINWLVFITEMKSVYSAVRTGSLNKAVCASSLKGFMRGFLLHVVWYDIFNYNWVATRWQFFSTHIHTNNT